MRHRQLGTGIALLVFGWLATSAGGQAFDGTVSVRRGKARFGFAARTGEARHSLKLRLQVAPAHLSDWHDSSRDALRVSLDGTDLCAADPGAEGYRRSKRGRWRYRGEIAGGRVDVSANPLSGAVKVSVRHAALSALRDGSATDLPLTLELAGTVLETTAGFDVRAGRVKRWTHVARAVIPGPGPGPVPGPVPGPGPTPGPDPDPLGAAPTGAALRAAILADLQNRGEPYFTSGTQTPGGGFNAQTLRCPSGKLAEVVALAVPLPGSADMFSDTAYFCRDQRKYWAHRTGGFAGVNLWLGPYDLP